MLACDGGARKPTCPVCPSSTLIITTQPCSYVVDEYFCSSYIIDILLGGASTNEDIAMGESKLLHLNKDISFAKNHLLKLSLSLCFQITSGATRGGIHAIFLHIALIILIKL